MPERCGFCVGGVRQGNGQEVTTDDMEIVSALRLALADRVGQDRFDLWFGPGTRLELGDEVLSVTVANQFTQDWLRTQFRGDIEAACTEVLGRPLHVEFHVNPSLASPGPNKPAVVGTQSAGRAPDPDVEKSTEGNGSRRRFARLDTFVVGEGNRVAHASAEMIVRRPGEVTPLFVYGPNGVGKTHLLEGIWSAVRQSSRSLRMIYLSAEQFTSYFLEALRGSGLPSFRRKYRDVGMLIIDDVQFFSGKRATLVELQHTIDTLLRHRRQLVLAGDRPPVELDGLGPELTARMSGGLVCGMIPPDHPTRLGIVRQMARRVDMQVPEEVLRWIATHLTGDARLFSGALNRLRATSAAIDQPITRAMAEEALSDLIRAHSRAVGLGDIERVVCDVFGLDPRSLRSDRKAKGVSHPRMLAMWLARKHTRAALSEISHHFGRRSHSTVISAQKKVSRWMADGAALKVPGQSWKVEDAIRKIEGRLLTG